MDKYLKMADAFPAARVGSKPVKPWADGEYYVFYEMQAEYAAHAINSHDELVEMNKELLAALEAVIEWYDMEADHSIEPDFCKRMAACQISEDMAREAISKAKGGAA